MQGANWPSANRGDPVLHMASHCKMDKVTGGVIPGNSSPQACKAKSAGEGFEET